MLAALVYVGTLHAAFLGYDDPNFITTVEAVQSPSLRSTLRLFDPTKPVWGSYHPLHILSYVIDALLFGGLTEEGGHGFHATNVACYAICAVLVVRVARRFGAGEWGSLAAGVLFAVHPSHVESAAWLTGRKDLLSGIFVLLALLAATRPGRTPRDRCRAFAFFVLALMSKTTAVVLAPFLVLEALFRDELDGKEAVKLSPFVALAGAWLAIEYMAQRSVEGVKALRSGTMLGQLRVVEWSLPWYPVRFFWPHPLTTRPDLAITDGFSWGDVQASLVLGLCLVLFLLGIKKERRLSLAIGWFFLALAPVSNFAPMASPIQDRYLFLPSVAACCVVGELLARFLLERSGARATIGALFLGGAVGVFAGETVRYARTWQSDTDLWRETLAIDEKNPIAHWGMASAFTDAATRAETAGKKDEARDLLARAAKEADVAVELYGGGQVLQLKAMIAERRGLHAEARRAFEAAWGANASETTKIPAIGAACVRLALEDGDQDAARVYASQLVERCPESTEAAVAQARIAEARGELEDVAKAYERALDLGGGNRAILSLELAKVDRALARYDAAASALAMAESAGAKPRDLHVERGWLALARGDPGAAVRSANAALAIDPDDPMPRHLLGRALAASGRLDEAADVLGPLAKTSSDPEIALDLARVHARAGHDDKARAALERAVALDARAAERARKDPLLSRIAPP